MAKKLHSELLQKVMNAPVNLYFDVTPVGKLLGNFTSDIGRTDRAFFWHVNWVLDSVIDCIIKISIAVYFSPLMLIAVAINCFFLWQLHIFTKTGKEECARVAKKQEKSIHTHFSETYDGLTLIRAFKKQDEFIEDLYKIQNDRLKCQIYEDSCHWYFQVRLFFLSNGMFCCSSLLCIYLRGTIAPLWVALLFQ